MGGESKDAFIPKAGAEKKPVHAEQRKTPDALKSQDKSKAREAAAEKDEKLVKTELGEKRQELKTIRSQEKPEPEKPQSRVIPSDQDSLAKEADERFQDYTSRREEYYSEKRKQYFGDPKPETWKTRVASKLKPLRNLTRMFGDTVRSFQSIGEKRTLPNTQLSATVLSRSEVHDDPQFQQLLSVPDNHRQLMDLMDREFFREVNCRNVLMLRGLKPEQFHLLARQMGDSPRAFLSDDRGENAGRYATDNVLPPNGEHPFVSKDDPDYEAEKALWGPVYPGMKNVPVINDWMMSRTHSVIYGVKDMDGSDVLLMPIHVDPLNPVTVFRFGKKTLDDHKTTGVEQVGQAKYVGTGLYDLGIKYMLRKLNMAKEQGLIADLKVNGEEKLATTGKITKDDEITMKINAKMPAPESKRIAA